MSKQTKMNSTPPDKVIEPEMNPDALAASIKASAAPIKSVADNPTPRIDESGFEPTE